LEEFIRDLPGEELGHADAVNIFGNPSDLSGAVKRQGNGEYCVRLKQPHNVQANIAAFPTFAEAMACAELFRALMSCAARGNVRLNEKMRTMISAGRNAHKVDGRGSGLNFKWREQKSHRIGIDAFQPPYEDAFHSVGAAVCFQDEYETLEESISDIQEICTDASEQKRRLTKDELAHISEFAHTANEAFDRFRSEIVRFLRMRSMARRAFKNHGEDPIFNGTLPSA